jgi:hypothetical protein
MTKVLISPRLLAYQRTMKEAFRNAIQQNSVGGMAQAEPLATPPVYERLLASPCVHAIYLEDYHGQEGDFIGVMATGDFGIPGVHIFLWDEQGSLIEKGWGFPFPADPEIWCFVPKVTVRAGTRVTVQVVVTDHLGGIGVLQESKVIS